MMTFEMYTLLAFLLLQVLFANAVSAYHDARCWTTNTTVGMPINTTSGMIIGHATTGFPTVSEYLAIPFAVPPINNLRFAPPVPFNGTKSIVAATQPASCVQQPASLNLSQPANWIHNEAYSGTYSNHTSEDCLYLNVWTKFPVQGAPLKPVMIWIFGGGFHGGGASNGAEQGGIWAEQQDVVFVNLNYRLGIFGFPGAPNSRQNLALLDQRLAIEWVRDNVAGFGGDPNKITMFGHSAGGASTDFYNYAWTIDPIISGSIIMSGNVFSFGTRQPSTAAEPWYATSELVGCGTHNTTSDSAILACMQAKNVTQLYKASLTAGKEVLTTLNMIDQEYVGVTGIYGPTIDNITVFENYTIRGEQGAFIQLPIITGSADDEACLAAQMGSLPVANEDYITTYIWTCPTYLTARNRVRARVPAWQYRFFGAYPNTYAPACPGRPWHGLEDFTMFNATQTAFGAPATQQEENMGWYFRQAFANFARDPYYGLVKAEGWPALTAAQDTVMVLGLNDTLAKYENADVWNKPCLYASGAPIF